MRAWGFGFGFAPPSSRPPPIWFDSQVYNFWILLHALGCYITAEDPFDAPTYNIPEKPVTFTEGASYTLVILVGLGLAAAAGYAVFKELIFEPKEYKIFNMALKRIQDDSQVRVRIGSPITGYGQESRNRAFRQRIPNKIYTDEDGIEHVLVSFHIRGPHGAGKVLAEMFRDKVDK